MDKTKRKFFRYTTIFRRIAKWIFRWIYIILAACMIGFANAYNNESRWINDTRSMTQQEQVDDDDDTNL